MRARVIGSPQESTDFLENHYTSCIVENNVASSNNNHINNNINTPVQSNFSNNLANNFVSNINNNLANQTMSAMSKDKAASL